MATTNPITEAASSSSKINVSSSKTEIPGIDTAALIGEVMSASRAARSANTKMVREVTALAVTSEEDQKAMSDANRAVKKQAIKAKLQSQQTGRHIAQNANYEDMLVKLAAKQSEYMNNAIKQMDDVVDLQDARGGNQGALKFLKAGIIMPREVKQAKEAKDLVDKTAEMIKTIELSSTSTAKTLSTLEEVHTEATLKAMDDADAAAYRISSAERASKLAGTNAQAIVQSFELTAKGVEVASRLSTAETARMNAESVRRQTNLDKANAEVLATYATVARMKAGKVAYSPEYVRAIQSTGINSNELRKIADEAALGADIVAKDPEGAIAMGSTPADSRAIGLKLGDKGLALPSNNNKAMQETDIELQQYYAEKQVDVSRVPQDQADNKWNEIYLKKLKTDRKAIKPGGESTASAQPYSILMRNKAVRDTPLHKKVLSKLSMADVNDPTSSQLIDEQKIWDTGVAAVVAKQTIGEGLTHAEFVSSIKDIFTYANVYDKLISQYEKTNATPPVDYNSVLLLDKGSIFGFGKGKEIIDLTDEARIQYGLIKSIRASVAPESQGQLLGRYGTGAKEEIEAEVSKEGAK